MKVLAPAGNFECLKAAVYNGADEVYLGINQFNARNNVDGFTLDNLAEAVDFAHIFGVKVNLAINILFTDNELNSAVEAAVKAFNLGVDAFIVQDLGFAKILSRDYPQMQLHASTQMGIHNLEGVKFIEQFGFKRVVLSRETSLDEIKRIHLNSNVEIEYFAHGALCVSFSGNCYLSSYLTGASGNRGRCKQLCRLPFRFGKKDKILKSGYLLSAKDFDLSNRLDDLKNAGVGVIKIEGRARRAFYVATATAQYKRKLNGEEIDQTQLKLAFNRGFTQGYFNGNGKIISEVQSHVGVYCGKIEKVNKGKTFSEVFFSSKLSLSPKSTFKVFDGKVEKSVFTAYDLVKIDSGRYRTTTTQNVGVGDTVNLIIDAEKEKSVLSRTKKQPVDIRLFLCENQNVCAEFCVNDKVVIVVGDKLQTAKNNPLTISELEENFSKSEFFDVRLTAVVLESVFLPKKQLNEFRRKVLDQLKGEIIKPYYKSAKVKAIKAVHEVKALENFETIFDENAILTAQNVIYSPETYSANKVLNFIKNCNARGKTPYLDTPNFATEKDIAKLTDIIDKTGISIVANNYYALNLKNCAVIGGGLNVYNMQTAAVYGKKFICAEGGLNGLNAFAFMTLKHCPMKTNLGATCDKCPYDDGYYYLMDNGKKLNLKRKKLAECTFYIV